MQRMISCHRNHRTRGSALVEMAIMLPVLIVMFIGMVEFGQYITMRERMNKVSNQISGTLYQLSPSQIGQDGAIIRRVLAQAPALAKPYDAPSITVRFCEYGEADKLTTYRLGNEWSSAPSAAAGGVCAGIVNITCRNVNEATSKGYGAFVQVTSCTQFKPLLTGRFFQTFNESLSIVTTSYTPLIDSNQTEMLAYAGGGTGRTAEGGGGSPTQPCTGADCGAPDDDEEADKCSISSCPSGSYLAGSGASCSCQPLTCPDTGMCPSGYNWDSVDCSCVVGDKCEAVGSPHPGDGCGAGKYWSNANCQCMQMCSETTPCGELGQERNEFCACVRTSCPPEWVLQDGVCVADAKGSYSKCEDEGVDDNKCICPDGSITEDRKCTLQTWCPTGQESDGKGGCVNICPLTEYSCNAPLALDKANCTCKRIGCSSGLDEYMVNGVPTCGQPCMRDQHREPVTGQCIDSGCQSGKVFDPDTGECVTACPSGCFRYGGGSQCVTTDPVTGNNISC